MPLADDLDLKINLNRLVAMLLVWDLGEIDAGDKFVFAHDGWEKRKAAELGAFVRIRGLTSGKARDLLAGLSKEFDAVSLARLASRERSIAAGPFS